MDISWLSRTSLLIGEENVQLLFAKLENFVTKHMPAFLAKQSGKLYTSPKSLVEDAFYSTKKT